MRTIESYKLLFTLLYGAIGSNAFTMKTARTLPVYRTYRSSQVFMTDKIDNFDVAIIGGGIGGMALGWALQENKKLNVAIIDPRFNGEGTWYPNYGEWRDEWHHVSELLNLPEIKECTTNEWEVTDCFFGGSFNISMDQRMTLKRPYVRVDRIKLQSLMKSRFLENGGVGIEGKVNGYRIGDNLFSGGIIHTADGSIVETNNGKRINCKVLVDASGLESRFTSYETPYYARGSYLSVPIGYQIAYGFIAHVDKLGPYDVNAMTLFDYRTDHYDESDLRDGEKRPTFMYTMPLGVMPDGNYRVFFEETSLVGRSIRRLGFEECKKRAMKRLDYHGIKVLGIEEEELCYIPMGGEIPQLTQRIVAFAGAANMVHPSTGYQACRMLSSVADVSQIIHDGIKDNLPPDAISVNVYKSMWSSLNRRQRDFQVFGGDFLMEQNVENLRGFFSAFFSLNQPMWAGFLAGWPNLPNNKYHDRWDRRLQFALELVVNMPITVALNIVYFSIIHTIIYGPNTLLRSLTPGFVFGTGPKDPEYKPAIGSLGDEEVKDEARRLYREFVPTAVNPFGVKSHESDQLPSPYN